MMNLTDEQYEAVSTLLERLAIELEPGDKAVVTITATAPAPRRGMLSSRPHVSVGQRVERSRSASDPVPPEPDPDPDSQKRHAWLT
jgi:hypothetical protein